MDIKLLVTDIITSKVLFGSKLFSKIHHPILVCMCIGGGGCFLKLPNNSGDLQFNSILTLYLETVQVQAATCLSDQQAIGQRFQ